MKTKKLSLNMKTIANLDGRMIGNINGGSTWTCLITCDYTCDDHSVCPTHCETCVSICQRQQDPGIEMMMPC